MIRRLMNKFLSSPLPYLLGFAALSLFVFNSRVVLVRAWSVWQENKVLEEKTRALDEKNAFLAEELEYARSAGFKEREGKARLNLKRPGEEVVVIVPEKTSTTSQSADQRNIWQRFLGFIGLAK